MSKIKVSIIIPVYNAEKHLKQCLNSLISQTINEIEIICVDDCSTDNSQNIIEDFNTKDDRIRYFSMRKNSGSGLARNKGINHAKGEYLSFVDADDHIINTNCYEEIYKFAHKNSADMVSTNLKSFTNDGKYFQNKQCFEIKDELPIPPQDYGIPWYHQKNLYKRSFLIKNNIEYPDYKRGQDPVFLANILINLDLVYCLPIDFYAYRSAGVKTLNSKDKELDYIKHYRDVMEILNTKTFKEVYLNYEERLYNHFISTNSFSDESIENSVKTVFGENSKVYTIYKLKKILQNKEKEIEKLNKQKYLYEERIEFKEQLIKRMNSSNSWKLTIPLRRIGKLVKKNK
jgi:glycosyltransferase involved in cell wall biosynthesis